MIAPAGQSDVNHGHHQFTPFPNYLHYITSATALKSKRLLSMRPTMAREALEFVQPYQEKNHD
ncbi:hypothetical protein B4113_0415 [Geobacillus sp. B4113_201601]|nr:hypothetical protein B4113_0415 [Geobacillus sp. B4113_201601]